MLRLAGFFTHGNTTTHYLGRAVFSTLICEIYKVTTSLIVKITTRPICNYDNFRLPEYSERRDECCLVLTCERALEELAVYGSSQGSQACQHGFLFWRCRCVFTSG